MGVESFLKYFEKLCEDESMFKEVFKNTIYDDFSFESKIYNVECLSFYDFEKDCFVILAFAFKKSKES
jgi:hypothetical protein